MTVFTLYCRVMGQWRAFLAGNEAIHRLNCAHARFSNDITQPQIDNILDVYLCPKARFRGLIPRFGP